MGAWGFATLGERNALDNLSIPHKYHLQALGVIALIFSENAVTNSWLIAKFVFCGGNQKILRSENRKIGKARSLQTRAPLVARGFNSLQVSYAAVV
jgi:hypothetical protein